MDDLYEIGTRFITILGGEATLRQDFGEIVDYITRKGILVELSTNFKFRRAVRRYASNPGYNFMDKIFMETGLGRIDRI